MGEGATSASLVLIAIGAILRWAVTAHVSGLSLPTVGLVLLIVGVLGLILSLFELFLWAPRRRDSRVVREYEPTNRLT